MSFLRHAEAYGLLIRDVISDGRWHRVPTVDKPKKRNGAYLYDGYRGVVKNFATMQEFAAYREGRNVGPIDKSMLRARRVLADEETLAKQSEARDTAHDMLRRAVLDVHPYLAEKGFPQEKGFVLNGELLIPMREFKLYKQVNSLQRIGTDGTKLFLSGGKAKGSVFFIGPYMASERWLVEGYATGLSVHAALQHLHRSAQVVICFSASNLAHIGKILKTMRPKAFVFADNDESEAGVLAAQQTGLPWMAPPSFGMDANDYHQREGIYALANLMREGSWVRAAAA